VLAWATSHTWPGIGARVSICMRGHQDSKLTLRSEDRSVAMPPVADQHDKLQLYIISNLCSLLNAVALKSCRRLPARGSKPTKPTLRLLARFAISLVHLSVDQLARLSAVPCLLASHALHKARAAAARIRAVLLGIEVRSLRDRGTVFS
jgi:hypothetical protein